MNGKAMQLKEVTLTRSIGNTLFLHDVGTICSFLCRCKLGCKCNIFLIAIQSNLVKQSKCHYNL